MTLSRPFVATVGSVTGSEHRRALRDGQDGFALVERDGVTAAIVTDGCSSGRMSEVGARLGAVWVAELVASSFAKKTCDDLERVAREICASLIERIERTARSLSRRSALAIDPAIVEEMLLFGFLAAVVINDDDEEEEEEEEEEERARAIVFGVGDGLASIDGKLTVIDPGPDNAPIYPAYALFGRAIDPHILFAGNAADVESIVIATDGAEELVGAPLHELTHDDRLLSNPSLLRKRLIVQSDRGAFWDDTTIAILRRRPSS